MGEVVVLDGWTRLEIPAERVLSRAIEADLETAVVMGYDKDGNLYFAATTGELGTISWLMEKSKLLMHEVEQDQS